MKNAPYTVDSTNWLGCFTSSFEALKKDIERT